MNKMRKILIFIILSCSLVAFAAQRYEQLSQRAARSFEWKEWSSAAALYELMLQERPDSLSTYSYAIVANQMIPDTAATVDLLERAMSHGLGLEEVLEAVRTTDFSISQGDLYGRYLLLLRTSMPWMKRGLDHQLLKYYTFRHDGPMMVKYASDMLAGLPNSTEYLSYLAKGYLLCNEDDKAVETWKKILDIDPKHYTTLLELGNYYLLKGNETEALPYLEQAQSLHPTPYVAKSLN